MDPTFAHTMRLFLVSLDDAHRYADGTREGNPIERPCTCGDPQADGRDRHLLEVITAAFAEPELEPHAVHVDRAFEDDEPAVRLGEHGKPERDEDGKPVLVTGRRYVGPTACPDCRRGLSSRGTDLICPQISMKTSVAGCHEGCIVACGGSDRG